MTKTQSNATCHGAQLCFWKEDIMIVKIPSPDRASDSGREDISDIDDFNDFSTTWPSEELPNDPYLIMDPGMQLLLEELLALFLLPDQALIAGVVLLGLPDLLHFQPLA